MDQVKREKQLYSLRAELNKDEQRAQWVREELR